MKTHKLLSNNIIVRRYQKGDEFGIVELLDHVFQGWPDRDIPCSKVEHWRWKYLDNPLGMNNISVAITNDKIIGANHGIYFHLKLGEKILLCSQGTDAAVHPDYQGQGLYTKLGEPRKIVHQQNNREIDVSILTSHILIERAKRLERHFFHYEILNMLKVQDVKLHLAKTNTRYPLLKGIGYKILKATQHHTLPGESNKGKNLQISPIDKFTDKINTFWNEIKNEYAFIYERTKKYMNWRYCNPCAGNYTVLQADNDGKMLGYIVLKVNKFKDYPVGNITDLLTLPNREDVISALLEKAIQMFNDLNVNSTRFWVIKNQPIEETSKKIGFVKASVKPPAVIVKPEYISKEWKTFLQASPSKVHLQMGDTEWM